MKFPGTSILNGATIVASVCGLPQRVICGGDFHQQLLEALPGKCACGAFDLDVVIASRQVVTHATASPAFNAAPWASEP